jgi:hypothetical protein
MGNRKSRPAPPPIPDMYRIETCTGFTRDEYDKPRLEMAPFLSYNLKAKDTKQLTEKIVETLTTLPIPDPANIDGPPIAPPPPKKGPNGEHVDSQRVLVGPVYLFVAYDVEKQVINGWLFLPSMTKDGHAWPNYHFLGITHRWLWRLMYGPSYYIRHPQSSCDIRIGDRALPMGCRTDESYRCLQSKKMHKRMKLYNRKKRRDAYPAIYYRVFRIDLNHERLRDFVHPYYNLPILYRNILSSGLEMYTGCRYMLVSPNQKHFLILGRASLTLFRNIGDEDIVTLCLTNRNPKFVVPVKRYYFYGFMKTKLVIEDEKIRVYSELGVDVPEEVMFERRVVVPGTRAPLALVLHDDGSMVVYDYRNQIVSTFTGDEEEEYDPVKDRKERMLQLIAYLKLLRIYKEVLLSDRLDADAVTTDQGMQLAQDAVGTYDSKEDYLARLAQLLEHLITTKRLKGNDPNRYGFRLTVTEDTTSFDFSNLNKEFGEEDEKGDRKAMLSKGMSSIAELRTKALAFVKNPHLMTESAKSKLAALEDLDDDDPCNLLDNEDQREECIDKREEEEAKKEGDADKELYDMEKTINEGAYSDEDFQEYLKTEFPKIEDESSSAKETGLWNDRYECPPPTNKPFTKQHDMYCRLLALHESIRKQRKRLVVLQDTLQSQAQGRAVKYIKTSEGEPDFDASQDRQQRLDKSRPIIAETKRG